MKNIGKLIGIFIIITLIVGTMIIMPAANAEEIPPYDYSSFIGSWYNRNMSSGSTHGLLDEIQITSASYNSVTFNFIETAEGTVCMKGTYPIINNRVQWTEKFAGYNLTHTLVFNDDSIYYSEQGNRNYERWFTSNIIPRKTETGNYSVILNGAKLEFDQSPVMCGDKILVPLRKIFEELGATVDYKSSIDNKKGHNNAELVTVSAKTDTVELILNSTWKGNWQYKIYENGVKKDENNIIGTPPMIINGRTLIPVRFVSEAFGAVVGWDGSTNTVFINTNGDTTAVDPYSKILYGDLSDFIGVYENAEGYVINLQADGTEGKTIKKGNKVYGQVADGFSKSVDGSYQWGVNFDYYDEENGSHAIWLYPVGVDVSVYGTIINTDTSKIRLYSGQDFCPPKDMPNQIYYKK